MPDTLKKLRIFVASPGDVAIERARLASVVEQLNHGLADHLGVVLELKEWSQVAPNMGRGQQVIFDQLQVETWDVMIGILWLRYGTPSGSANPSESGTHEEFRSAYECYQETGKPRIMFYRCTRPPEDITKLNVDDFGKINAFFKEFEVGGKNQGFYKAYDTPENFERFIRDHLERFLIDYSRKIHGKTISPDEVQSFAPKIPNNLPRRAAFFGRAKEMDVVMHALSPADRTWGVLVDGIGGIGKSAIAIEAAHCAQDAGVFDAFVFVTAKQNILEPSGIREKTPAARTLDDFLNETARVLGEPGIPKLASDEKRRALLDAVHAMRALLIYDNLETLSKEEQEAMADFLRELPQGCKAIITSRRRGGEGGVYWRLEKLDWEAACGIIENEMARDARLANKLRRVESRWQELYDETNGSPLALVHTLGLMRVRAALTFDGALRLLRGAGRNDDLVKFVYQEARKELTTNDETALGALSFFVPSATFEAWMQVANLSRNALETTIDRLSALSLVDLLAGEERYALHPLTRAFVRDELLADANLVSKIGMRFARYWVEYAKRYGGEEKESYKTYDKLEVEWANLHASENWLWEAAVIKGSESVNEDTLKRLDDLVFALAVFLDYSGRWDESVRMSSQLYHAGKVLDNLGYLGKHATRLAAVYLSLGCIEDAALWSNRMIEVWSKDKMRIHPIGLWIVGSVSLQKKDYAQAKQFLSSSLSYLTVPDTDLNRYWRAVVLCTQGNCAKEQADFDAAEKCYCDGLELVGQSGYKEALAICNRNLGDLALEQGRLIRAQEWFGRALSFAQEIGYQFEIARAEFGLARVHEAEGRADLALPLAQESLKIFERLQHQNLAEARELVARLKPPP